jgi:hypothetical protein
MELTTKDIQKYSKRSVPWLKGKAVEYFNAWIRERDRDGDYFTCISCNRTLRIINYEHGSNYHAGHYYPGTESALKFNELNVNGQCDQCNRHKHGNQTGYREGLIKKYGIETVKQLEYLFAVYKREGYKWDRFFLISIILNYKTK